MIFRLLVLLACLLPLTVQANLLPGQAGTGQSSKSSSLIDGAASSDDFLKPEQAFKLSIQSRDMQTLLADFEVTPGYYLYRQRISFKLQEGSTSSIAAVELPKGEMKHDPNFGDMEVYHQSFQATVRLQHPGVPPGNVTLLASFQGCSEKGLCYAPIRKTFDIALGSAQTSTAPPAPADSDQIRRLLGGGKLWLIAAGFFGFGLLLSFTPCVFPMIPILSGIIVGHGEHPSRAHAFYLSLAYTLGMAVAYALAGIAAGLSGHLISNALQNPWALGFCAALFVALALSMFGLFDLQMPSFIQSRLHYHSHKVKGGSYIGAFFLGIVSALIVGACVSPVLLSVLGVAITTKDPTLGGGIMFAMAHGQGVILVAVGVGAGFLLPRAGAWMDRVKYVFGVMLIGVAIYLLGTLPQVPVLILWSLLLIMTAVFLGATQSLPKEASGWQYLWKGFGTFLLLWGVLALFGGLMGERDILKPVPLQNFSGLTVGAPATAAPTGELFQRYTQLKEVEDALARARREGKPALVDFYATWCTDCVRMEKTTFADPRVRAALSNFVLIKADVTDNNDASTAIKQKFSVFGPPALLLFGADGNEKKDLRFYGYRNVEEFLALLGKV